MERIDKILANKGFGSRKEVKKIIKEKRVYVNEILVLKDDLKISENDLIQIDDIKFKYNEFVYIMLNKPNGVISSTFDTIHQTVLDLIDDKTKGLFPVGRLDIDTEGLCLISNDGILAHNLLSNKKHVEKVYEVHTLNELSLDDIKKIENGLKIDNDEICLPAKIINVNNYYELSICEGKYHQIKRMMLALNNEVTYLKRIKMGKLILDPKLSLGEYRYLSEEEIQSLK
ncbi:MAG: pseudouridine synthase [Erysipelotrichaceae bacterium]|nr:pseudouridine synthase [Erysipelotrichaceae bacterium]